MSWLRVLWMGHDARGAPNYRLWCAACGRTIAADNLEKHPQFCPGQVVSTK